MSMFIGIDASRYDAPEKTGVEVYSLKIIEGLIQIAKKKPNDQLIFYSRERLPRRFGAILSSVQFKLKNFAIGQRLIRLKRLWTQLGLSLEMLRHPPDLLFVPSHALPIFLPKKSVITIHDIAFMFFRKAYGIFQYRYLKWTTAFACKRASKIIVPSLATKNDLVAFFRCPESKIVVIPHGVDFDWKKELDKKEEIKILKQFGLIPEDNYLFFVGRLEKKKNLENVIRAYSLYLKKYSNDLRFIMAGKRGIGFKNIWETINDLGLEDKILMPGYVNEVEKEVLLKYSKGFIFISLYEGFGFPILEAFRARIPVITANISAMKEVAAQGALRVNPLDVQAILSAFEKILHDEVTRHLLIHEGEQRLAHFDWKEASEKTWEVLVS